MNKLLKATGFISFISMVFLNAFVDLGHKIIIQNTVFKVYDGSEQIILTSIVNGLILLPFILLFTPSGFLADRFKKPHIMRLSSILAIGITLLITLSYYMGWFKFAFAMTFILAMQSAFYSPSKYGYIREIAGKDNLAAANSFVQATTIVAILLGMFVFSILFENALSNKIFNNEQEIISLIAPIGWLLVLGSVVELYFANQLPHFKNDTSQKQFDWLDYRTGKTLKRNLTLIRFDAVIWLSIIGLSVFWGVSQAVLATFPAYAKETLDINNTVIVQGLLACSGFGIITGSLLAGRISSHYIETALIPIGSLGIVISLFFLSHVGTTSALIITILGFGFFGGLFIIPLNALIQFRCHADELGIVLAGNNWVQNVAMLGFLMLTALFALFAISSKVILYIVTLISLVGAIYTVLKLPQSLIRYFTGIAFSIRYRIQVQGFEHIPSRGGVLLLGNHISWLDWAILQIASPRPIHFVMHKSIYQRWHLRWFLNLFSVIPISTSSSKKALSAVNNRLKQGEVVCLFPEGTISRNGHLGEFKKGFERCVEDVDGVILPFYLRGLWGSRFSRSNRDLRQPQHRPIRRDIIVTFGQPLCINSQSQQVKQAVSELSILAWQHYTKQLDTLGLAWIKRSKQNGSAVCLTDIQSKRTLSRRKALVSSLLLTRRFRKLTTAQNLGLFLPTSSTGILANMATFLSGKTAVNLNITSDTEALLTAVSKADITTAITSKTLIDNLAHDGISPSALFEHVTFVYIEELYQSITKTEQLLALGLSYLLPAKILHACYGKNVATHSTAAILFSSEHKNNHKGVMLSHQNIMGNIKQISDVLGIQDNDVMVDSLPLFHALGLTVTSLLPMIEGIPAICHSNPADTATIAKGIQHYQATILCSTPTFLTLYYKNQHVQVNTFASLRIVVAGAKRFDQQVREQFSAKFGQTIYQAYGTIEISPVATVNIPDRIEEQSGTIQVGHKIGSVGLPLPGSSIRIVDPETMAGLDIGEDGLILIGGAQLMQGYVNDEQKSNHLLTDIDGHRWYKTGDKGHLDADGFLTIID